jgi:rhodanese-related sulfurtransferase
MDLTQQEWVSQYDADENAIILDVRTENECDQGIIPNSINIDIYEGPGFIAKVEALDRSKKYYVYCRSGARSAKACEVMKDLGFEYTYNLEGGILGWNGDIVSP